MRTPGDRPPEDGGSGNSRPADGSSGPASGTSGAGGGGTGPAEVGRVLAGRYRVTGRIGRGGMGVVWRAVDEVLGREVAVKELRTFTDAGTGELDGLRTRMQREARAAARVRHAGVVAVHDVAQHEGRPVIVMELIEGPSLDDVLRERGTLQPREAAAIGAEVMDALAAAHRAGVLHRDVKPGNVLLENGSGRVVLTDFGIASVEDPDDGAGTQLTGSGELVGSLDYLAPERARGEAPSAACDVWALGATLYAAVEGAVPFRRTSTWSTLNAIVVEPLPEPRRAGPLRPVLAELMEKDPAKRADAERAKALLQAVAKGTAPPAGPSSTMRLGAIARPEKGAPQPKSAGGAAEVASAQGQSGPQPPPGPAQGGVWPPRVDAPQGTHDADGVPASAAAASPAPGHGSDTDRHTVNTRAARPGGRRRALIAAAVAAALLTGAGAAYAVMAGTVADSGDRAGAGAGDGRAAGAGKPEAGSGEGGGAAKDGPASGGSRSSAGEQGATGGAGDGTERGGADGTGDGKSGAETGGSKPGGAGGSSGGDDGGSGGSGGEPAPEPACHPRGGGKFDCTVWKTATSYNDAHEPVGQLNAGPNYFYCQAKLPQRETSGRWTNVWWAKTDDDSGNTGVFISDVYIKGGDNDRPVPGLPVC